MIEQLEGSRRAGLFTRQPTIPRPTPLPTQPPPRIEAPRVLEAPTPTPILYRPSTLSETFTNEQSNARTASGSIVGGLQSSGLSDVQGDRGSSELPRADLPDVRGQRISAPTAARFVREPSASFSSGSSGSGSGDVNLGGLLSGFGKQIVSHIPVVGQVYDAFNAVKQLTKDPKAGPLVTASIPMPVPSIIGSSGRKETMPGGGGTLPTLGTRGGPFGDVSGGSSSTADRGGGVATGRYPTATLRPYRKYRRMNPMNVKALRRAARRLESGEKLFRKVFSMVHHKPAGAIRFKKRRKR